MTRINNTAALYAARWIDRRLRELVMHWQPTMEAISDAHRETVSVTADDPRDFKCARAILAGDIARMRGEMIREAEKLLALRRKITPRGSVFPQEPPEVLAELKRLRRLHDEYLREWEAEEEWFENAWEYSLERARCEHDGDVLPNPADYGLGPASGGTGDESEGTE
jgi:hypothetical protein